MAELKLTCRGKYRTIRKLQRFIDLFLKDNQVDEYSLKTIKLALCGKEKKNEYVDTPDRSNQN